MQINDFKKQRVWVNWIAFDDPASPDEPPKKIPRNPHNIYPAKTNDPKTWGTFEQAKANVGKNIAHRNYKDNEKNTEGKPVFTEHRCKIEGIGFMFSDGICGIDIDNKKEKPELDSQTDAVIALMDAYTERSPSGTGYHIIFKCDVSKLPPDLKTKYYQKNPHNELEAYVAGATNRYFTYTDDVVRDMPIEDRTEQFITFLENYMLRANFEPERGEKREPAPPQAQSSPRPRADILEKARNAKNGVKFSALFDYGDISGYNSQSEADLALCNRLCFWTNGDASAIDGYFRQSKLMRKKWDERHGADTYGNMTINRALDNWDGQAYRPPGRPKTKKAENRADSNEQTVAGSKEKDKQLDMVDIAAVKQYLQDMGISVKYNRITRNIDITGETEDFAPEHIDNNLPFHIYNDLKFIYKKCPKSDVFDSFQYIATNNAYNPVLELIEGGKWDGVDRFQELFKIMRIRPGDSLSKSLIHKWLWQNISMARNDIRNAYGADGLLVLQGRQGIGKTTFARKMALKDEFFADGLHLNFSDKDTLRRAGSCWIGELGEISRTFKSDIDALKAFITTPVDKYRQPYARFDDNLARRTSFIGTCNDEHYLIDETGNRRFWTVHIPEKMDLDALQNFDALQLYLQVYEQGARDNIQGFRLTDDEQQMLAERNSKFEKPIKAELEIRDILSELKETGSKEEITASKFKEKHPILFKFDVAQIGKALKKNGVEFKQTKKGTLYLLPMSMPSTGWNAP